MSRPAIIGGTPAFPELVPMVRPTLPEWGDTLSSELRELIEGGMLTKGTHLDEMEERMSKYLGVRHVVGVANCTMGLLLTARAMGLSGEVIVPSFTFMATVHPFALLGLEPAFVDIDERTWNISVEEVERAITPRTSAIVAVHVFGNPAKVKELEEVAARHHVKLLFDAAHGFGASYQGSRVGAFGDAEVFSMSPTKLLVAGEGGIVATNDRALADTVRMGREYGNAGAYDSAFPGLNGRLAEFNAILAIRGLEMLDDNASRRRELASVFQSDLRDVPGVSFQEVEDGNACSYKDLAVLIDEEAFGLSRDALAAALRAENVDTRSYYDPPVHRHRAYASLLARYDEALPVTDTVAGSALSLPIWSHMPIETVRGICAAVSELHSSAMVIRDAASGHPG